MKLDVTRLPCGVSATTFGQDDNVAFGHAGIFTISIKANDYIKPRRYYVAVQQDMTNVDNPYVKDPGLLGFWLEIVPK